VRPAIPQAGVSPWGRRAGLDAAAHSARRAWRESKVRAGRLRGSGCGGPGFSLRCNPGYSRTRVGYALQERATSATGVLRSTGCAGFRPVSWRSRIFAALQSRLLAHESWLRPV